MGYHYLKKTLEYLAYIVFFGVFAVGVNTTISYLVENYSAAYEICRNIFYVAMAFWFIRSFLIIPYLEGRKEALGGRVDRASSSCSIGESNIGD